LAPIVDGKPDITRLSEIDLEALGRKFRLQKVVFETAREIYDQMNPGWKGHKEYLLRGRAGNRKQERRDGRAGWLFAGGSLQSDSVLVGGSPPFVASGKTGLRRDTFLPCWNNYK